MTQLPVRLGDLHYQAPKRLWARKASPYAPVYVYYFDGPPASNQDPHDGGKQKKKMQTMRENTRKPESDYDCSAVSHSSELPLIFGNIDEEDSTDSEISETRALAEKMRNRYISFVYELNPGG
jgi:carboxylesterase type B